MTNAKSCDNRKKLQKAVTIEISQTIFVNTDLYQLLNSIEIAR